MSQLTPELVARRTAIINEHAAAENAHDVQRTLKTFHDKPHYWVRAFGAETDGAGPVAELLGTVFTAFPDFHFKQTRVYHAADALIMEGQITGTHRDTWAGVPASGKQVDFPICAIFHFDEDRLVSETVYFDHATLLAQIGAR
jgi:steroid delta-isomerase-like uncharacterized protein